MSNALISDEIAISIATVPDIEALRAIHKLDGLSKEGVLNAVLHLHNQRTGSRTLPLYQQQIVSLAVIKRSETQDVSIACLGNTKQDEASAEQTEANLLKQLNALIGSNTNLIAWELNAHDLPIINYRLLKHSIVSDNLSNAATVDLRSILSNGEEEAIADLAGLASSLGLPETPETNQQQTIDCFLEKQLDKVHIANQARALNSYLIYLRYQLIQAKLSTDEYQSICESLREAKNS